MISSIFSFIRPHIEDNRIKDFKNLLKECGAWSSFEELFTEFGNQKGERIATFIVFMYCSDSSFFIGSDNYRDVKNGIAELCGLNVEEDHEILNLKNGAVIKAINFVASEVKSWKFKKLIALREAAANLEKLAMEKPDSKQKNASKNIRDSAIFSIELSEKADAIENQIYQQTKSKDRLKETIGISIDTISMERLLREIK